MEYIIVDFKDGAGAPLERDVLIDDQNSGKSNTLLIVGEGHHLFKLVDPQDYTPPDIIARVQNTTPDHPMRIAFNQNGARNGDS